jgi:hypothetical protein
LRSWISIHSIGNTSSDFSTWRRERKSGSKCGARFVLGIARATRSSRAVSSERATIRRLIRDRRGSKTRVSTLPVR